MSHVKLYIICSTSDEKPSAAMAAYNAFISSMGNFLLGTDNRIVSRFVMVIRVVSFVIYSHYAFLVIYRNRVIRNYRTAEVDNHRSTLWRNGYRICHIVIRMSSLIAMFPFGNGIV